MTQRDNLEIEALVADRYLDSLLAARDRHAFDAPADAALAPNVRNTAQLLEAELDRVHPSFRFEERLADLLRERATQMVAGERGSSRRTPRRRRFGKGVVVPLRPTAGVSASPPARLEPVVVRRPLIIGGALTSAALSIAGAVVAWRRGRPPINTVARAVRAAHRSGVTGRVVRQRSRPTVARVRRGVG